MNDEKIKEAVREAKRFIEKAKTVRADWRPSKEAGALKRASMDLTRALAELRKPL